eukprot:TRINITY_DN13407_c1_g1_i1.p1 TRINITY_DN13407_c1_g1~~TRINITY_DN13407_c1_g1_i1.p1  ORF type:complete len:303 (-),score=49.70 TRINITY_DN13407_c1_g1_i1:162-1070(-)
MTSTSPPMPSFIKGGRDTMILPAGALAAAVEPTEDGGSPSKQKLGEHMPCVRHTFIDFFDPAAENTRRGGRTRARSSGDRPAANSPPFVGVRPKSPRARQDREKASSGSSMAASNGIKIGSFQEQSKYPLFENQGYPFESTGAGIASSCGNSNRYRQEDNFQLPQKPEIQQDDQPKLQLSQLLSFDGRAQDQPLSQSCLPNLLLQQTQCAVGRAAYNEMGCPPSNSWHDFSNTNNYCNNGNNYHMKPTTNNNNYCSNKHNYMQQYQQPSLDHTQQYQQHQQLLQQRQQLPYETNNKQQQLLQ